MTNQGYRKFALASVLTVAAFGLTVFVPTSHALDVYSTPVGVYKLPVTGSGYTAVGVPLQLMKADQGLITSVSSNVLGVSGTCASCATSNYWDPTSLHFVEFLTGGGLGRYFAVQTNTATTITLAVGTEDLTVLASGGAVAIGDRYVIRPFMKLRDIFGPASACALQASTKVGTADNVLIWNGTGFITAFPNSGAGVWVVSGSANDNFPILPDEGLFVLRRSATGTNGVVVGEVRTTNTFSVLQGAGYNFVCNAYPSDTTLDSFGLTNSASGFHGGTKVGTADNVLIWDPVGQSFKTAFFNTGAGSWVVSGSATNGYPVTANSAYFIFNKTTGGYWNKPLPYAP